VTRRSSILLLHHKPLALLLIEVELRDGGGFRSPLVWGLYGPEIVGAFPQDRGSPTPKLGGGGFLFRGRSHARHITAAEINCESGRVLRRRERGAFLLEASLTQRITLLGVEIASGLESAPAGLLAILDSYWTPPQSDFISD
jgi:hypothetical protein